MVVALATWRDSRPFFVDCPGSMVAKFMLGLLVA